MSTRIDPTDQSMIGKISNKTGDTDASSKVRSDSPPSGKEVTHLPSSEDTVELTSNARLLERLERNLESVSEIDRARVDAVKQQIENGEYQIDAENIANAILKLEMEINGRNSSE